MSVVTRSIFWQPSLEEPKTISEGADSINQGIRILLSTQRGTCALLPTFGCGLYDLIDKPVNVAVPLIIAQVRAAIAEFMPEIDLVDVSFAYQGNPDGANNYTGVVINIVWTLNGLTLTPEYMLVFLGQTTNGTAVLGEALATEDGFVILIDSVLQLTN